MRAYGKMRTGEAAGELSEVTITANPEILRELARWIESFAEQLEQPGRDVSHVHFREEMEQRALKTGRHTPDIVLSNPRLR